MTANKKAVQVRIDYGTASNAGHQRAHDLRTGPQPDYVDTTRSPENRVLITPMTGLELRGICETRREQRATKRGMKSNAAVCISGIITFGHEAQPIFELYTPEEQDAAYREVAERVAARISTTLSGLVVHVDEAADHAHFQCPGFTLDGQPVSAIAKREALRDIQTIAAEVMGRHAPGIERGKSRWQRIKEGESYADTVYKNAADMRDRLPAEIADKEAKLADVQADLTTAQAELAGAQDKLDKNQALLTKAQADLERAIAETGIESDKAEKIRKRATTYENRVATAQGDLERLTKDMASATAALTRIRDAQSKANDDLAEIEAQKTTATEELDGLTSAVAQKKTKIGSLIETRNSLQAKLQTLNAA